MLQLILFDSDALELYCRPFSKSYTFEASEMYDQFQYRACYFLDIIIVILSVVHLHTFMPILESQNSRSFLYVHIHIQKAKDLI